MRRSGALLLAATLVLLPSVADADIARGEPSTARVTDGPAGATAAATADSVEGGATEDEAPPLAQPIPMDPQASDPAPSDPTPSDPTPSDPAPSDPAPSDLPPTSFDVTAAQLRWGLSNEANNRAFAPDTFNHFSAGRIADPGSGGNTLTAGGGTWSNGAPAGWSASAGRVSVEKFDGTTYLPTTWEGLSTDSTGAPLGSPLAGTFSNHQLVFDGGTGTVDPDAGTATIRWTGDATVLFYSGMSFFYISDPVLEVDRDQGISRVRATLGGFGASQADPSAWAPLPPTTVTLAELGLVDLSLADGFTVTPRYLGVPVTGVGQVAGPFYGSFPQSFVDFQNGAGAAGFWFSSGGSADEFKQTLPMTVSYDAAKPISPPAPQATSTVPEKVDNVIRRPPARRTAPDSPAPQPSAPPAPLITMTTAPVAPLPFAIETYPTFQQVAQPLTASSIAALAKPATEPVALWWWLGIVCLSLAGSSVAATFVYSATSSRR